MNLEIDNPLQGLKTTEDYFPECQITPILKTIQIAEITLIMKEVVIFYINSIPTYT